ncbi:MAG: ABC transporter ATP-binding protein [Chloroflexota bacterium]
MTDGEGAAGRLVLRDVRKSYGDARAVDGITIDVQPSEFITFLGPSGSGKTTTLRMIAGFLDPDGGSIELDGGSLVGVPPYRRDIGMVFQNYALFPHMTAADNVAFPLRMRSVARPEIERRVADALALVRLDGLGARYPRQLSGGQQQRVALARAVVFGPRLLLMDEPLGALDKKLREALQLEIMRISRQLGTTVVYVTHDQEEALVMSDRIAIYNRGRIEQLGRGEELYDRPGSLFVADFIGQSNIVRGRLERAGSDRVLVSPAIRCLVNVGPSPLPDGARAAVVVRPERLLVEPATGGVAAPQGDGRGGRLALAGAPATIVEVIYLGSDRKYVLRLADGTPLVARRHADRPDAELVPGAAAFVDWRVEDSTLLPDESPDRLASAEAGAVIAAATGGAPVLRPDARAPSAVE